MSSTRNRMDPSIKKQWVSALRGGHYKQAHGRLRKGNGDCTEGFCCLGVLCDLASDSGVVNWENIKPLDSQDTPRWACVGLKGFQTAGYDISSDQLPKAVMEWSGLDTNDPQVIGCRGMYDCISHLNDTLGYTFSELADLIEEQL